MKIDFDVKIKNLYGKFMKEAADSEDYITLGSVCINALTAISPNDQASGNEKFKRYKIASKIANDLGKKVTLSSEEIVVVKEMVGIMYAPMVIGPVYMLLEGEPTDVGSE